MYYYPLYVAFVSAGLIMVDGHEEGFVLGQGVDLIRWDEQGARRIMPLVGFAFVPGEFFWPGSAFTLS